VSTTTLTPRARRRVLWFSVATWVVGALVVGSAVTVSLVDHFARDELAAQAKVWNLADPPVATQDGDVWSGDGAAKLALPESLVAAGPLLVEFTGGDTALATVRQTEAGEDTRYPGYVGALDTLDPEGVALTRAGSVLWVDSRGSWSLRIAPLAAEELTTTLTGKGDRYIVYRGDALSGTLRQEGSAFLTLLAYGGDTVQYVTSASDSAEQRISWKREPDTDYVVFELRTDGPATWSIAADELAAPTGAGG
jgi:hypothetical protein